MPPCPPFCWNRGRPRNQGGAMNIGGRPPSEIVRGGRPPCPLWNRPWLGTVSATIFFNISYYITNFTLAVTNTIILDKTKNFIVDYCISLDFEEKKLKIEYLFFIATTYDIFRNNINQIKSIWKADWTPGQTIRGNK